MSPNGAHTLTARARDTDNKTTVSTLVNVTVANSETFQNQVLATGFDLPTTIEFLPDGRMLWRSWRARSRCCRRRTPPLIRACSCSSTTSGPPAFSRGSSTWRSTPTSRSTTTTTSSIRWDRQTSTVCHGSLPTSAITGTDPNSEVVLYQDPGIANSEHHGGAIAFGNDGKLYFTTGEHFQGSPSQDLSSPRGKVHRINPDGTVPTDNPFYDGAGPHWDSVWAYGLRNPYPRLLRQPNRPAPDRRRRRQRHCELQRGAEPRRPRRQLRLAGPRGAVSGRLHQPAVQLRAPRDRRVDHGRVRLPRHAVPHRDAGELLLRRLRPALDQAHHLRRQRQRQRRLQLRAGQRRPDGPPATSST